MKLPTMSNVFLVQLYHFVSTFENLTKIAKCHINQAFKNNVVVYYKAKVLVYNVQISIKNSTI